MGTPPSARCARWDRPVLRDERSRFDRKGTPVEVEGLVRVLPGKGSSPLGRIEKPRDSGLLGVTRNLPMDDTTC
jgi:hypothetical protein